MSAKFEKKIRKAVKKDTLSNYIAFTEAINKSSFGLRLKFAIKAIMRKL